MVLVVSEKPSVAQSIAKVLGAAHRKDGYTEGNGYLVSWCIGHLIELAEPQAYDPKFQKWRIDDLPILPGTWQYKISRSTKKQFKVLKELLHRTDVDTIVNACDAGREGELIFRLVYAQADCRKPVQRLWISSMEDSAIRDGFANLKPSTEYDALYEAALCRERADWLVGMNATRLFSCLYGPTLNIGRVMTPTLAMVVLRDAEIKAFRSQPFWTVQLSIDDTTASSRRFEEKQQAEDLLAACRKERHAVVRNTERKEKTEHTPLLYDLTSLQRDANRILGYTAQQTLNYTQSLYEKKLVTYPRTDSRYLTDDMSDTVKELLAKVAEKLSARGFELDPESHPQLFNSRKVSDHHAIIPTKTMADTDLSALPSGEQAILQLISIRLLCAMADDYRYAEETIYMTCGGEEFTHKSRVVLQTGWKGLCERFYPSKESDSKEFLMFPPDDVVDVSNVELKEGQTSPKKPYTEATLLASMETAGSEKIPEETERKGLGTSATRAGIIEKLVKKGFIERKGGKKAQHLCATEKGNYLIAVMPEQLRSASMTAEWEQKLLEIERGTYDADAFMSEIQKMVSELVSNYETVKGAEAHMAMHKAAGKCPHCGADVIEREKGWFCANRQCRFILWKDNTYFKSIGKHLSAEIVEKLLQNGHIRLKDCKSKRTGKTFNAKLILTAKEDGRAEFSMDFRKEDDEK